MLIVSVSCALLYDAVIVAEEDDQETVVWPAITSLIALPEVKDCSTALEPDAPLVFLTHNLESFKSLAEASEAKPTFKATFMKTTFELKTGFGTVPENTRVQSCFRDTGFREMK